MPKCKTKAVADPGFPVGGRQPRREGANSRGSYVSKNCMSKRKNLDPSGGRAPAAPPGSATEKAVFFEGCTEISSATSLF